MSKNKIQRFEWEDALIEAEAMDILPATAVNVGLRLARQINWNKRGAPAGLYWANEDAAKTVSVSRSTLFRGLKPLKEHGFFVESKGNLLPTLPKTASDTKDRYRVMVKEVTTQSQIDTSQSQNDTTQSQNDTAQSQIETPQSQNEHPFTVDTFSDDLLTDDAFTLDSFLALAGAQAVPTDNRTASPILKVKDLAGNFSYFLKNEEPSLSVEDNQTGPITGSGEVPQSQIETRLTLRQRMLMSEEERRKRWIQPSMAGADDSDEWL